MVRINAVAFEMWINLSLRSVREVYLMFSYLRRVSPCSSTQRNHKNGKEFLNSVAFTLEENAKLDQYGRRVTTATQTTLVLYFSIIKKNYRPR